MKLIIASLFLCLIQFGVSQKVDVAILYESLCPDSIKFIREQLYPNWVELSQHINLFFVPFGKSSSLSTNNGETTEFECQHGPMECAGNKIQSCALSNIADQNTQVEFVHCFMNSFGKKDVGQECTQQIGLNWEIIEQCYNSKIGTILQLNAEAITKSITPKFVPTIIFNRVFNQEDQNDSLVDFKSVVCKHLNKVNPGICQPISVLHI